MTHRSLTLTICAALVALAAPATLAATADDGVSIVIHDEEGATSTESGTSSDSAFWIEDEEAGGEGEGKPSGPWGAIGGGGLFGDQAGWFGSAYVAWPAFYVHGGGGEWQDVDLGAVLGDENEYGDYNGTLGWRLPWVDDVSLEVSAFGSELTNPAEFPLIEAFGWSWGLAWEHAFDNGAHIYLSVHGYDIDGSYVGTAVEDEGITATLHGMIPFNDNWYGWGSVATGMQISIPGTDALGVPRVWRIGTTWMLGDNFGIGAAYGQTDWDASLLADSQTTDGMAYIEIFFG